MDKPFQFKQFSVHQQDCAMKVGTDGVLLGAWAAVPSAAVRGLDIGTGTGLIALMLAQRFPALRLDAIDVDSLAAKQAAENFSNSSFHDRLSICTGKVQDFAKNSLQKYDVIVSNPPFFAAGKASGNEQRAAARHQGDLSIEALFAAVEKLLAQCGVFSLIIPTDSGAAVEKEAQKRQLHMIRKCTIFPNYSKASKRTLFSFSFTQQAVEETVLTIETEKRHQYTSEYKTLLKDFYLAF